MRFTVDTSSPLVGRVFGHPEEVCRLGHECCADTPGGACSQIPVLVDRMPLEAMDDTCACGGDFRAIGGSADHYLFECSRCRRRVQAT